MVHCDLLKKKCICLQYIRVSSLSAEEVGQVLDGKGLFFCAAHALNKTITMFQLFVNT